jgi:nucleotide-binding universal stress UspA family protein
MGLKSIVCGITGSENSQKAMQFALKMALADSARLTFVYVVDVGFLKGITIQLTPQYAEEFLERLGNRILDEAMEIASSKGLTAKKVVRKGKIMEEVCKVIKEEKGDILVVGDEGRSFAQNVLFGKRLSNTVKEMERLTGVPVKVVR